MDADWGLNKESLVQEKSSWRAAALRINISTDGRPIPVIPVRKRVRSSNKACAPHLLSAAAQHFRLPGTWCKARPLSCFYEQIFQSCIPFMLSPLASIASPDFTIISICIFHSPPPHASLNIIMTPPSCLRYHVTSRSAYINCHIMVFKITTNGEPNADRR